MSFSDFLIIYFACGAPCGVYFFLQNRKNFSRSRLWLKAFLTVIVWIPYAFRLLHDFVTNKTAAREAARKSASADRLIEIQKSILRQLNQAQASISPFEFREVLERYAGLTLACQTDNANPTVTEKEVFRVALRPNHEIGSECLHRRNRQKLLFHQTLAREDFLKIMAELKESIPQTESLEALMIEFTEILRDPEAREAVAAIFFEKLQTDAPTLVRNVENVVWNSTEHKPSMPINRMPFHSGQRKKAATIAAAAAPATSNKGQD